MNMLNLKALEGLIGHDVIREIKAKRGRGNVALRERKLGVIGLISLCLAVAANTQMESLGDILKKYIDATGTTWSITAAGFSKARKRFSPRVF